MLEKLEPSGVAIPPNLNKLKERIIKNSSGLFVLALMTKVRLSLPKYLPAKPAAEFTIRSVVLGINHQQNTTAIANEVLKKVNSFVKSCSCIINFSIDLSSIIWGNSIR